MRSVLPDFRYRWFWRAYLLVAMGVLIFSFVADAGMAYIAIFLPDLSSQSNLAQIETFRSELRLSHLRSILEDLILIPVTVAQYGFCAQRRCFSKQIAIATFWIAAPCLMFPLPLLWMADFPGHQFNLAVKLFVAFELIVMWFYIYASPHLWESQSSSNI